MSKVISITIVGDGSSDRCLEPIIQWILDQAYANIPYTLRYASNLPPARDGLRKRILSAIHLFPCDILIVHRDSERQSLEERTAEVVREANGIDELCVVPAIPVRMIESWLLVDKPAIRRAANNPNGTTELDIPSKNRWEHLPDPKESLFALLRTATELNGRRLDKFSVFEARIRLSTLIEDFSALRDLQSFNALETRLLDSMKYIVHSRTHV